MKRNPDVFERDKSRELAATARQMGRRKKADPYWQASERFWREQAAREAARVKKGADSAWS